MTSRPAGPQDQQSLLAVICIGLGLLLLLRNIRIIFVALDLVVALALIGLGLLLYMYYRNDRQQWWALFPAVVLPFQGLAIGLDAVLPRQDLSGPIFLLGAGLSFLAVYYVRRQHWWPLIPAGLLLTWAAMDTTGLFFPRMHTEWILFFGLAATFGAVYAVTPDRRQVGWALAVAIASAIIGLLTMSRMVLKYALPLLLIGAGVFLLVRFQRQD